jgi:hypothetical protein
MPISSTRKAFCGVDPMSESTRRPSGNEGDDEIDEIELDLDKLVVPGAHPPGIRDEPEHDGADELVDEDEGGDEVPVPRASPRVIPSPPSREVEAPMTPVIPPRRPTPKANPITASNALFLSSDEEAIDYIKARLRMPFATWVVRIGGFICLGALGLCWLSPNFGTPIQVPAYNDVPYLLPFSILVGAAIFAFGALVILAGQLLRRRRRRQVMMELRGTRYVQLVPLVIYRRV